MRKNEDDSVTLTKREFSELNKAYQRLYHLVAGGPSSLYDYCDSHSEYLRIARWQCQLAGEVFHRKDWE